MPNRSSDTLFQLIKSLEKSEKRNFKLYIKRNSGSEDLKSIQLFDALDKMEEYDEAQLLKKNKNLLKQQLSNAKAHLYREILTSLRLIRNDENVDIQLHEQLDFARILYNKGLYLQSLKTLDKIKEQARARNQITFLLQVLFFEKTIEALHITRSMQDRADQLATEVNEVNSQLQLVSQLSNLSLELYSWYIRNGVARNEKDEEAVQEFFEKNLPPDASQCQGFYAKLYLYQSYTWYAFIRQDFLSYYRYTQKWVDLFEKEPYMVAIETSHYIKGMHNLLGAHFDLLNDEKFRETLDQFEAFSESDIVQNNVNNRIQMFIYLYISKLNLHFIDGTFTAGLGLVPYIEEKLKEYWIYLDRHRILVFYYKIACLYFGSGDYEQTIVYLNKIINWKVDLRTDLQCYSRLLHLIAHYELGNFQLLEYLTKSVYRFMAKMGNLSLVEEEIFRFLRKSFNVTPDRLRPEFEKLVEKLKKYEKNRFETRASMYLDVISWLESKIQHVPVQDVIREKYLSGNRRD
jgi:CII-binding regulator of phage lambda lysogenization HflD